MDKFDSKSKTWKSNINNFFSEIDEDFLYHFREINKPNSKITAWSPIEKSSRWFKFFLFNRIKDKEQNFFSFYKNIKNTNLGNPITVLYNNLEINLDYLLAIEEFEFINNGLNISEIKSIIEIGAGFGRTAHVLLTLMDSIESYSIIDLPELLVLSKKYLRSVLPENLFSKINFYENTDEIIKDLNSDLVININSFQEMPIDVLNYYMKEVVNNSSFFYSRNAICKYDPSSVDIDNSKSFDVFEIGYCREVVDIFNNLDLTRQVKVYLDLYKPTKNWIVLFEKDDFFPYYYNVLYKKNIKV